MLLRCNINTGVHAPARSGRVTQRCHNGKRATECGWHHAPEARGGFWGFSKKAQLVELSPASGEDGWLSLVCGGLGQVSNEMGGRWKSQNRKNVYLSPYVEKRLNSKVIKSFVPELRSRKCFSRFEIPMFYICIYIYIWTFYVHFAYPYLAKTQPNKLIYI